MFHWWGRGCQVRWSAPYTPAVLGGGAVQVPGQPLLLFTLPSLHSLLPISKVAFSVEKPQNLTLFENFFLLLNKRWIEEYLN